MRYLFASVAVALAALAALAVWRARAVLGVPHAQPPAAMLAASQPVTFNRDVAPIVFQHCAECHRPGGAGPFNLLTYDDVRKRARQIAKVTARRLMPPWLPEPGCGEFLGARRLDDAAVATFQRWLDDGTPAGAANDLPPLPPQPEAGGWELGKPDLVLTLAAPFTLDATSAAADVYRNFVLPAQLDDGPRYVRAVEFHSGNTRVVHHAFLLLDATGAARRRAARDGTDSYPGMDAGTDVAPPPGQLLSWQPGKRPAIRTEESPWLLAAGTDVVVQAHLRPTGKPEVLQPSVGLYFTDKPASESRVALCLRSVTIDIPPGTADYEVAERYVLPVDVDAMAVSAHAHYLGKDLRATATLPDGTRQWLLRIKNWDFDLQGTYAYARPVFLPRGTAIDMRFSYDNSAANPRNPNAPPARVVYGPSSRDEMGELWLQLRPRSAAESSALQQDYFARYVVPNGMARFEALLARAPNDAGLHADLAAALLKAGKRLEAGRHLQAAFAADPNCAKGHLVLARLMMEQSNYAAAADQYRKALAADPDDATAQADLALALGCEGKLDEAVEQFRVALRLNPRDPLTHTNLGRVYYLQHKPADARAELETALRLDPNLPLASETLKLLGPNPTH